MSNQLNIPQVESNEGIETSQRWSRGWEAPGLNLKCHSKGSFVNVLFHFFFTFGELWGSSWWDFECRLMRKNFDVNYFSIKLQHNKMWKKWRGLNTSWMRCTSLKINEPTPEATMQAQTMTVPQPCFIDEFVCFGSWSKPFFLHTLASPLEVNLDLVST